MPCLGSARLVSDFKLSAVSIWLYLRRPRSSPRSVRFSYPGSITTPTRCQLRRAFSLGARLRSDFFEYTSGRWIFNDDIRHAERRLIFKVDELSRLAAESVNRSPDDIVRLEKLAEGGFNRTFLITMCCGFQMVARIPYPATVPKYFAVASEVATMAVLRSFGLPVPAVYGYSPSPNNAAGTEYIFMEFVRGTKLSDIWFDLGEGEIISMTRQLAELESKMMSIAFPAGGSLYYSEDLNNVAGSAPGTTAWPAVTLENKRFCVGPDTNLRLWFGRRSQLDVDQGPYGSAEETLVRGAEKELAYLRRFVRPLLPFQRVRREAYKYQEQPPSDHIENVDRYLRIASQLIPRDPTLSHFRIRHPDLQPSNIIVSKSPDSNLHVVGLIDWQHTSILPMFLLAGIPQRLQNYGDPISQSMTLPSLPEKFDDLDEAQQSGAMRLYRRRLVHYHYVKNTQEFNEPHYAASTDFKDVLRRRLFDHARDPWEGETLALKVALIDATENWEALTGRGSSCPVVFDAEDVHETRKLDEEQNQMDKVLGACQNIVGFEEDGWVPAERYEQALAHSEKLKEDILVMAESEEERVEIAAHWPLDDMDEEPYN